MNPPRPPSSFRPFRSGFPLIELLTVIAIIGILAAILIPVVGKVRGQAKSAQCRSNLRQIGMAYRLYAENNNGRLPGKSGIPSAFSAIKQVALVDLQPYIVSAVGSSVADTTLEGVWRCPAGPEGWITYSPNNYIWELKLSRLHTPSRFAMLWNRGGTVDAPPGTQNPGVGWHGPNLYNTLYADIHVEGVTKERLLVDLVLPTK